MREDYYATLKMGSGASNDDINKAYRKLSMNWHPDKNPNNRKEVEANFKHISKAYEEVRVPVSCIACNEEGSGERKSRNHNIK